MSNIDRPSVGIIGLGIMGGLMAKTLIENGFKVFGRDIEPACNQRLRRAGAARVLAGSAIAAFGLFGIAKAWHPAVMAGGGLLCYMIPGLETWFQ